MDRVIPDGLYRVVTPHFVAGFVVQDGCVMECAPILRKRIHHWMQVAERVMVFIYVLKDAEGLPPLGYFTTLQKARNYALGFESIEGLWISEERTDPMNDEQWESKRFEVKL
jgi:hypothetical protein